MGGHEAPVDRRDAASLSPLSALRPSPTAYQFTTHSLAKNRGLSPIICYDAPIARC